MSLYIPWCSLFVIFVFCRWLWLFVVYCSWLGWHERRWRWVGWEPPKFPVGRNTSVSQHLRLKFLFLIFVFYRNLSWGIPLFPVQHFCDTSSQVIEFFFVFFGLIFKINVWIYMSFMRVSLYEPCPYISNLVSSRLLSRIIQYISCNFLDTKNMGVVKRTDPV